MFAIHSSKLSSMPSMQYLNKIVSVDNIQFLGTKKVVSLEDIKVNASRHIIQYANLESETHFFHANIFSIFS